MARIVVQPTYAEAIFASDTIIDLTQIFPLFENWDGSNPFQTGHLRLVDAYSNRVSGSTLIQVDWDGIGGTDSYTTLLKLNWADRDTPMRPFSLSIENFDPLYTPFLTGSGEIFGKETADTFQAWEFSGTLYALGGDDFLVNPYKGPVMGEYYFATVYGGAGDDHIETPGFIDGGLGADVMIGGFGADTFVVDNFYDQVNGGFEESAFPFVDTVISSISYAINNTIDNLTLMGSAAINGTGNSLNNVITGNAAANIIYGGAGADIMDGGLGDDIYSVDNYHDQIIEEADAGTDTVQSFITYALGANLENLTLAGTAATNASGNEGNNSLIGNNADNIIYGGLGADRMMGLGGNDIYSVDNAGDVIIEAAGGGTDTVQSFITYVLGGHLENLTLAGTAAINATGNAANNSLKGNAAANIIYGGVGADNMMGLGGNDIYSVDNGGDVVIEAADGGTDTVQSFITYVLGGHIENLTLAGMAAINATGNALNNAITGNSAANIIYGGLGADKMAGLGGNDIYSADNGADLVIEAAGGGTDTVQSFVNWVLGANIENLTLAGSASIHGTGNAQDNFILGNGAANIINGGIGADRMEGGLGNDIYGVDNVGDMVVETSTIGGKDTVQSSVSFALGANIENLTLGGTAEITGTGNGLDNAITGNAAHNILSGGLGADRLDGRAGSDRVAGGDGNDILFGGADDDVFLFDAALHPMSNVDRIADYSIADDTIWLDQSIFADLATGTLAEGAFRNGTAALDANDRILYDKASGNMYFDADGNGSGAAILFGQVDPGSALTHLDYFVTP